MYCAQICLYDGINIIHKKLLGYEGCKKIQKIKILNKEITYRSFTKIPNTITQSIECMTHYNNYNISDIRDHLIFLFRIFFLIVV